MGSNSIARMEPSFDAPPPSPFAGRWYVAQGKQSIGPFEWEEMAGLAFDGKLAHDTLVSRVGTKDWLAVAQVPELVTILQNAGAPTIPAIHSGGSTTVVNVVNHVAAERRPVVIEKGMAADKSPGVALILSMVICGLGQIYNGHAFKGIAMFVLCGLMWLALLGWIVMLWSCIDAYSSAKAMRRRYHQRMGYAAG